MKFEGARARNFVRPKFSFCSYFGVFMVSGGCKKIWSKIWIFHGSKVVDRGKYSLLSCQDCHACLFICFTLFTSAKKMN
jgi:hypothetical protein